MFWMFYLLIFVLGNNKSYSHVAAQNEKKVSRISSLDLLLTVRCSRPRIFKNPYHLVSHTPDHELKCRVGVCTLEKIHPYMETIAIMYDSIKISHVWTSNLILSD